MPPRALLRSFLVLWIVTGAGLLIGSITTARAALGATHTDPHIALLAAVEGISAALFLAPRALRIGAAGLLATLAFAFVAHVALGQFRWDLFVFGAAVWFVRAHGPLTREQLHTALSASGA